jgi:Subtilase family
MSNNHRYRRAKTLLAPSIAGIAGALILAGGVGVRSAHSTNDDLSSKVVSFARSRTGFHGNLTQVLYHASGYSDSAKGRIEYFKVGTDDARDQIVSVAVMPDGRTVDAEEIRLADDKLFEQTNGKIAPATRDAMGRLAPNGRLSVGIFLRQTDFEALKKPVISSMGYVDLPYVKQMDDDFFRTRTSFAASRTSAVMDHVVRFDEKATASSVVPVIDATLTAGQILELSQRSDVQSIDTIPTGLRNGLSTAGANIQFTEVRTSLGFAGAGVTVAQIELFGGPVETLNPYLSVVNGWGSSNCDKNHATAVAGAIRSSHWSDRGSAPEVTLWAGGRCTNDWDQMRAESDDAVFAGARTLNLSWGGIPSALNSLNKYYDDVVRLSWRNIVGCAGNEGMGNKVWDTAHGYNVIGVGQYNDNGTAFTGDDSSQDANPNDRELSSSANDRELPDVGAPGDGILTTSTASPWLVNSGGCSLAAPIVTGVTALMIQAVPGLASYPEVVKAALLASARRNPDGVINNTVFSETDGIGGVNAFNAVRTVQGVSGGYRSGNMTCAGASSQDFVVNILPNVSTRFVLNFFSSTTHSSYATKPGADLDLRIIDSNGNVKGSSLRYDSTVEAVELTTDSVGTYTIRVNRASCQASPDYFAVAWSQGAPL